MINAEEYFEHGRQTEEPSEEIQANATELLRRVANLETTCNVNFDSVASGWRPPAYNAELRAKFEAGEPGGAKTAVNSRHMTGEAVDLPDDGEQSLALYLFDNQDILAGCELWMEHPSATKGQHTNWCHVQTQPPHSGNRVFFP